MGIFRRFFGDDSEDPYDRMRRMREQEAIKANAGPNRAALAREWQGQFLPGKMFYMNPDSAVTGMIVSSRMSQSLILPEVW